VGPIQWCSDNVAEPFDPFEQAVRVPPLDAVLRVHWV
jgi:hypothetical protein